MMQKFYLKRISSNLLVRACLAIILISVCGNSWAQVAGDFRSMASGDWNVSTTWERYDGAVWEASGVGSNNPGLTPVSANSVWIQTQHVVTLTQNESCGDLHIATGTSGASATLLGRIALATFAVQVNGKLRCYTGILNTIPGTNSTAGYSIYPFTGTTGKIVIVGNTRTVLNTGEWGATISTPTNGIFPLEISLNAGQTITFSTNVKLTNFNLAAGSLAGASISLDNGTTGQGDATIASGATFTSTQTGTTGVFQRTGSTIGGTLTVNGTLKLAGSSPGIAMAAIIFAGLVEYSGSSQTMAVALNSGAVPNTYYDMKVSTANVANTSKTTPAAVNITITHSLTNEGYARVAAGVGSLVIMANGSTLIRNSSLSAMANANASLQFGTVATDRVNLTVNATSTIGAEFQGTPLPGAYGTLTIANGVVYSVTGARTVENTVLNGTGTLGLNPSTTLTFTITGSVSGAGRILAEKVDAASLSFTGTGAVGTVNIDQSVPGTSNAFNNLTLNRTAGAVIFNGDLSFFGNVTINEGLVTNSTGALSYKSAGKLVYSTGAGYTATSIEWPAVNGPFDVTVQTSGTTVLMPGNRTVSGALVINSATLEIGANTLVLDGTISGSGSLTGSASSNLTLGGTAGTVNFASGAQTLKNLTLNAGATATLGTPLSITAGATPGTVIVDAGATLTTGGNLTIKSDANGTARVGNSAGTIGGNVTVERYIAAVGRRWRLLSGISTVTSQNILNSWQEGGAAVNNLGTWITAPGGGNGFDANSAAASILFHTQSGPSWTGLAATNTGSINDYPGYMLFVRGDRNATPGNALNDPTVLRTTGTLRQGTQAAAVVASSGSGYTLVGNPFASAIDFESIQGTQFLTTNFYVWDPTLTGNFGVGGYKFVNRTGGSYDVTPVVLGGTTTIDEARYIHSGQAFFLTANGNDANVVFDENSKASGISPINPIVNVTGDQQLLANLMIINAGNVASLADGIRVRYDAAYSANTSDDGIKMHNNAENLLSLRDGKSLIMEKRPMITNRDTIFLNMTNVGIKNYRFQIGTIDFVQANLTAFLKDAFLNTNTPVDLLGNVTEVNFSVTADPASAAANRFMLVFAAAGPLPVTITSIKAAQQGSQVAVEWKATNQVNMKQYEVEKSTDGINYTKVNTQAAVGASGSDATYIWMDVNPVTGSNFYRLRSVSVSGDVKISQVVIVKIGKGNPVITLYPNPVVNHVLGLQFADMEKGIYQLRLLNTAGQLLFTKTVNHAGGSAAQTIVLDSKIATGSYLLEIQKPDKTKTTTTVLITE